MKFVSHTTSVPREELLALLSDSERVNQGVKFDEKRGRPRMLVKSKGSRLTVTCRYIGGASKDNGFLVGTVFHGRLTEKNGQTRISGIITTAPLYHLLLLALIGFFIYRCIDIGGINPMPIILVAFSVMMFWGEFKKQGVISRYLARAVRRAEDAQVRLP